MQDHAMQIDHGGTRRRLLGTVTALAVAAGLALAPQSAHAAGADQSALGAFAENLQTQAAAGDATAAENLAKFDQLTQAQKDDLAGYLSGTNKLETATSTTSVERTADVTTETVSNGDAQIVTTTSTSSEPVSASDSARAAAATYNVRSEADSDFTFAGISITKSRVWGSYVTGNNRVLSITDYGGLLVHNYDPTASIDVSKQSAVLQGGQATFKTLVVVKRGPIPYLGVSWSTRSAYQYMTVNGPGIVSHGWTS